MKKFLNVVMCFALIFGLASCGTNAKEETGSLNSVSHLNIAKQMVPGYIPLWIMQDKGWLEEALSEAGYDIQVTYTEFESGPPENEAFATGQQDIGVMGNVPAISGIAAGQKRDIIGIAYNGEKTIGILVQNNSDITAISELKGKKIGIVIGSIGQDYLNAMLEDAGITMNDVELINLGVSELETALATGQVDAVAIWNPTMLKICADGTGVLLADGTGVYAGENVIVANREYTTQNPDIVRIFMEQYQRAVDELKSNFEGYAEEYSDVTGLSKELLIQTWENSNFPVTLTAKDQGELEKTSQFLYDQNLIGTEVNIAEYLDFTFSAGE
ncbi:MAG: aliphatic sulfonate ABC transporter substrate-binding protein [Lachnospiraceae bacterium]|nr:aliphatic sulfonate ABC transporter substrate-binding protein [Lachnospiraceae bacterium]